MAAGWNLQFSERDHLAIIPKSYCKESVCNKKFCDIQPTFMWVSRHPASALALVAKMYVSFHPGESDVKISNQIYK
jgi:hypothetical protein